MIGKFEVDSKWFSVQNAIWAGLGLRLVVAIWNSFFGPSFGAGPDALGFHQGAVAYARGEDHFYFYLANIYMYILGIVYGLTVESLFLGSWLSCVAWMASAGVLYKMMTMLGVDSRNQFLAMLVYCALPSSILVTSVTLREAYQLLAVNLAVYSALKISVDDSQTYWTLLLAAVAALGLLHGALLAGGALTLVLTGFAELRKRTRSIAWVTVVLAVVALLAYASLLPLLRNVLNIQSGMLEALQARQDSWQQVARAHYSVGVHISSAFDLMTFVPSALFHYWFQPLPWNVQSIADVALLMENILRAWLLGVAIAAYFSLPASNKFPLVMTLLILIGIETLWALGTINWGTAARHHVPTLGLLVLAFSLRGLRAIASAQPV